MRLLTALRRWASEAYLACTNADETELVWCLGNRAAAERELLR
jgi:hypothetical protein